MCENNSFKSTAKDAKEKDDHAASPGRLHSITKGA
jgi:hypothetical protein